MRTVEQERLPNGLTVYAVPRQGWAASGIAVRVGSINDIKPGNAHAIEHVITFQNENFTKHEVLDLSYDLLGGKNGIGSIITDHTYTQYAHCNLRNRADMEKAFWYLAASVTKPTWNPDAWRNERGRMLSETYLRETDSFEDDNSSMPMRRLFRGHPLAKSSYCEIPDLIRTTNAELQKFWQTHYIPNNSYVAFVGPNMKASLALAKKHLGQWQRGRRPHRVRPAGRAGPQPGTEKRHAKSTLTHLSVGWPTCRFGDDDHISLDLLSHILCYKLEEYYWVNGNHGSTIYANPYIFNVDFEPNYVGGVFKVQTAVKSRPWLEAQVERICQIAQGLSKANSCDLDRAKRNLKKGKHDLWAHEPDSILNSILESACNGDEKLVWLKSYEKQLSAVTLREVRRAAERCFSRCCAVALAGPGY